MAPSQPSCSFDQAPQCPSIELQVSVRLNRHLPAEYPRQAQLQQELAIIGDEDSRLNLAKAYYNGNIAEERRVQHERVMKKLDEEKTARKKKQAEQARQLLDNDEDGAGPRTRSQTRKAAEVVDLTSDDGDDGDDRDDGDDEGDEAPDQGARKKTESAQEQGAKR